MEKAKIIIKQEIAQRELAQKHKKHLRYKIVEDELISLNKVLNKLNEPTTEADTSDKATELITDVRLTLICTDDKIVDKSLTKGKKYKILAEYNDMVTIINDLDELGTYHISFFN